MFSTLWREAILLSYKKMTILFSYQKRRNRSGGGALKQKQRDSKCTKAIRSSSQLATTKIQKKKCSILTPSFS
jgi:hypothetical protein